MLQKSANVSVSTTRPELRFEQTHFLYERLVRERQEIYDTLLALLARLKMSTHFNVQFRRWSHALQQQLGTVPQAVERGSRYRALHFLCDLMQFLAALNEQLLYADARHWQRLESETPCSLQRRLQPWSKADFAAFLSEQRAQDTARREREPEAEEPDPQHESTPTFIEDMCAQRTEERRAHPLAAVRALPFVV